MTSSMVTESSSGMGWDEASSGVLSEERPKKAEMSVVPSQASDETSKHAVMKTTGAVERVRDDMIWLLHDG